MNVDGTKRETTFPPWSWMMGLFGLFFNFETIHGIICWYMIGLEPAVCYTCQTPDMYFLAHNDVFIIAVNQQSKRL